MSGILKLEANCVYSHFINCGLTPLWCCVRALNCCTAFSQQFKGIVCTYELLTYQNSIIHTHTNIQIFGIITLTVKRKERQTHDD